MRQVLTFLGMVLFHSLLYGQNNDCSLAGILCDNVNITSNPDGSGFDDFSLPNNDPGCVAGFEHESEWYYFEIDPNAPVDSELGFIISPNAGLGEDYDFAVFGPNVNCGNLGAPIRCSYAATGCANCPQTGLDSDATDTSEGAAGDGIVAPLIVQPGEGYYLLIDNFLSTGQGFDMTWTGGASDWLNCAAEPPCAVNPFAGDNIEECQGIGTVSLSGSNVGQNLSVVYQWTSSGIGNNFIDNPNAQNPILNLPNDFSGTLNYTLTVIDGPCSESAEVEVNILPAPQLIVPLSTDFCVNDTAFTFPISPEGGTWNNLPNGFIDPSQLGIGSFSAVYSYSDTMTGCTIDEPISFTIQEAPQPTLDPIATTCVGENQIALNASPFGGVWSSNAPNGILNPAVVGVGFHNIEYTVSNALTGCSATAIQTVEILPELEIEIEGNTVFCIGESTTISVDPSYTSYLWSDNSTSTSITTSSSATFTVTVTNAAGCTTTDQVNVIEDDAFPIADAGNDLTLDCDFNFIDIGGNSSQGNMTYDWTALNPNNEVNASNNIQASVNQAGNYQLLVTNNYNGCTAIDEISVFENTNPPTGFSFDIDPLICFGDQDATLTITNVQNGTPPYIYSIGQNNFQNNNAFPFLSAEAYTFTVQDANLCEYEMEVTVPTPPEFLLNLGDDITISLGDEAQLMVQPNYNITDFTWQADSTLPCIDCFDPIVAPQFQHTYFASATSEEGCYTEDFITVFVMKERNVFIPNAFSPNEDGQNDIFKIYGGADVLKVNSFMLFNRWGEIMYEAKDFEVLDDKIGWDGLLKGKKAAQGVYVYFAEIEFIDGWKEVFRGDLTLIR